MRLELTTYDEATGEWEAVDTIAVDRIRALIDFVLLSSHRQRAKVAVIVPAERMHPSAANALLKTLEEPPAGTFLILVSDQPGRLPATIVSRCRKIAVALPPESDALRGLRRRASPRRPRRSRRPAGRRSSPSPTPMRRRSPSERRGRTRFAIRRAFR